MTAGMLFTPCVCKRCMTYLTPQHWHRCRYLTYLIERHFQYGVELVHYDVVLGAIAVFLGSLLGNEKLTAADREAWQKVLNIIKLVAKDCYHRRDAAAGRTQ